MQTDVLPCEAEVWGLSPLALNTWGGLGTSAKEVLFEVTKRATADFPGWSKTRALLEIREGISVNLMRQVARQLSLKGCVKEALTEW